MTAKTLLYTQALICSSAFYTSTTYVPISCHGRSEPRMVFAPQRPQQSVPDGSIRRGLFAPEALPDRQPLPSVPQILQLGAPIVHYLFAGLPESSPHLIASLDNLRDRVSRDLQRPDYYLEEPIHLFRTAFGGVGQLCWDAALMVKESGRRIDSAQAKLDADGVSLCDAREEAAQVVALRWTEASNAAGSPVRDPVILDCGSGTGASTTALKAVFGPDGASYISMDCNEYYLAVGMQEAIHTGTWYKHSWVHGTIEDPPVQPGTIDIAFISFVMHEVPATAWADILQGVHRSLRPGGVIAILDIDPKKANAGFAISEPFFEDYKETCPHQKLQEARFGNITIHGVGRNVLYVGTRSHGWEDWDQII